LIPSIKGLDSVPFLTNEPPSSSAKAGKPDYHRGRLYAVEFGISSPLWALKVTMLEMSVRLVLRGAGAIRVMKEV
jgi:hypothetical protein